MMKFTVFGFLLCLVFNVREAAADMIVAEYTPGTTLSIFGFASIIDGVSPAQTFTPTLDGDLTEIAALLTKNGPSPTAIIFQLRPTAAGAPTGATLASVTVPISPLTTTPSLIVADFSSLNIGLNAGTTYAFSLFTSAIGTGASAQGTLGNGFTDGAAYSSSNGGNTWQLMGAGNGAGRDLYFQVSADVTTSAVPEPASLTLLGFGTLGLVVGAYRRRRAQ